MMDVRPIHWESEYHAALKQIERYFVNEPLLGTEEADRFDLLALVIADYEARQWPIDCPSSSRRGMDLRPTAPI